MLDFFDKSLIVVNIVQHGFTEITFKRGVRGILYLVNSPQWNVVLSILIPD